MITPSDIESKQFASAKKGYNKDEVDEFLDLIILDMEKLIRENRQLKEELSKAHVQVDKHMSSETSVYETLEAAKALMSDIAASAERRAEILLKNAEMEADLITKEAKESISRLTDEASRMKTKVEMLRGRYKNLLETELERLDFMGGDLFEDFEKEFLPASMTDIDGKEKAEDPENMAGETKDQNRETEESKAEDIKKTMVNIR